MLIYHPVYHDDKKVFNEKLDNFYEKIPRNEDLLSIQDINLNIGTRS